MTWFAHQVFAQPRPDVVAALREVFGADALYRLDDLPAQWSPEDDRRLPMPTEGLLVVRELCSPPDHDPYGPWERFGADAVSWLVGPFHDDEDVAKDLTLPRPGGTHPDDGVPPTSLLLLLRQISMRTDSVLSLFCAGYWGGAVDYAHAWTFTGRDGRGTIHQATRKDVEDVRGRVTWVPVVHGWDLPGPQAAPRETPGEGVLRLTLAAHGVLLDETGFFAAHQRTFHWEVHRLPA